MIDLHEHGLIAPATPPRDIGGPASVAAVLDGLLASDPDRLALVGRHGRYTVTELDDAAGRAAAALAGLGVGPGDRVAVSLPNQTDIVVGFLGTMRLGAVWLGVSQALAPPEKRYLLGDAQVSVFVGDPATVDQVSSIVTDLPELGELVTVDPAAPSDTWRELLADAPPFEPRPIDPLAPAAIAYTSGTTGFPKGAVHTQHNLLLPGKVSDALEGDRGDQVLGVALPLSIINLIVLGPLVAYQTGMAVVAMDRLDGVGMAEWVHAEGITTFAAVPAMVHDLLTNPGVTDEMLASLRSVGVGGADMPDAFRRLYEERFGVPVTTGYGLTEAPTAVTVEDPSRPLVAGSCGRALPQVEILIRDDEDGSLNPGEIGEVCVGPAREGPFADCYRPMLGYWNRPEETHRALRSGVLHTGDLGVVDDDGNLHIRDRKTDVILRGGANVYPAEVERVLHDDPGVAACAVVGAPDDRLGERVVAFVQRAEGEAVDEATLIDHCGANLARYKVPEIVTFVDDFERSPMGKIKKTVLREQMADGRA